MVSPENGSQIKPLAAFHAGVFGADITRLLCRGRLLTVGSIMCGFPKGLPWRLTSTRRLHLLSTSSRARLFTLANTDYPVRPGDTIYIPPGVSHGFRTPDQEVVLLSVQSPPIYPEGGAPDQISHAFWCHLVTESFVIPVRAIAGRSLEGRRWSP